jgi:hypothetical protein
MSRALAALVVLVFALGGACGGSTDASSDAGASGPCVGNASSCNKSWELLDGCGNFVGYLHVEAAVFSGGCVPDATLSAGDTSAAVRRATFALGDAIPSISGLGIGSYGFAFVVRDASCKVKAFGCTEANLAEVKGVSTAVCDWSADGMCACAGLSGGGCPGAETCSAGACSGAIGG